jgi:hypothetical protein
VRFRRRPPSASAPPVARSECAENQDAVSTYRYRTASELACEAADREALVGVEREQFIRDFLEAEEEHQQDLREHRFDGLVYWESD